MGTPVRRLTCTYVSHELCYRTGTDCVCAGWDVFTYVLCTGMSMQQLLTCVMV